MSKIQQLAVGAVVAVAVVLAGAWFLVVAPKRAEAGKLHAQATSERQQIDSLRVQLAQLQAQARGLPAQQAKLAAISQKVPVGPALPTLIRRLSAAATAAGVDLVSLQPSVPTAVAATAGAATTGAPAAGAAATGTTYGLQSIPVTLQVTGGYFELEQLVSNLEHLDRAYLVNGFQVGSTAATQTGGTSTGAAGVAPAKGALSMTINGQVFTAPAVTPSTGSARGTATAK